MFRRAALVLVSFAALALAVIAASARGVPSVSNCIVPPALRIVGSNAGAPDVVTGKCTVTIRDIANNAVPYQVVTIDLSACPDFRIATNPLDPTLTVDCAAHTIAATTDQAGVATFTLVGAGTASAVHSAGGCARIYWTGLLLSSPGVSVFDLNGVGGMTAADMSLWLGDLGSGAYRERSDYNASNTLGAADLSIWLAALGRGGSAVSGMTCP